MVNSESHNKAENLPQRCVLRIIRRLPEGGLDMDGIAGIYGLKRII
jgi:hypothetical protein